MAKSILDNISNNIRDTRVGKTADNFAVIPYTALDGQNHSVHVEEQGRIAKMRDWITKGMGSAYNKVLNGLSASYGKTKTFVSEASWLKLGLIAAGIVGAATLITLIVKYCMGNGKKSLFYNFVASNNELKNMISSDVGRQQLCSNLLAMEPMTSDMFDQVLSTARTNSNSPELMSAVQRGVLSEDDISLAIHNYKAVAVCPDKDNALAKIVVPGNKEEAMYSETMCASIYIVENCLGFRV